MNKFVRVAIPGPFNSLFDYYALNTTIAVGARVSIPFGGRKLIGIVMEIANSSDVPKEKIKFILGVLDETPLISKELMRLCQWASNYYHHPIGDVITNALPKLLREGRIAEKFQMPIWQLTEIGLNEEPENIKRSTKQRALLKFLKSIKKPISREELTQQSFDNATIQAFEKKGFIEKTILENEIKCIANPSPIQLNTSQQEAFDTIIKSINHFQPFLLNGVTGSGKTEIYLRAIEKIIINNQQALVLVPEIGLTPQILKRFIERFNIPIAIVHSGLGDRERMNAWIDAKNNTAKIVIGTRSAIFTPFHNLGIIIIDEEHDQSFKQQDGFRYSARDLAIILAQFEKIPVVLGSATPSFETLHNSITEKYQQIMLPERAGNANHPTYNFIDLKEKKLVSGMSKELLQAIKRHITQDNQVMLFLNRRGYAPTLMCHQCGWIAKCDNCDAKLTYHQTYKQLHCHWCDSVTSAIEKCPSCNCFGLEPIGSGTERIEEALKKHFPTIPIVRIDKDATRLKNSMNEILDKIQNGQKQILIGTQMITKGHHFPNVTLVGIINADAGFFSADFRSLERTAQLLLQVSGRAGRAEKSGEVLIQTHYPDHPLLLELTQKGYGYFALNALKERKETNLPPYRYLALIRAESKQKDQAIDFLENFKLQIEKCFKINNLKNISLFGPIPSPMQKRKNYFHAQLLIQGDNRAELQNGITKIIDILNKMKIQNGIRWSIDVDPIDMF